LYPRTIVTDCFDLQVQDMVPLFQMLQMQALIP